MTNTRPSNLLALAVLALLFERPMHPYEMASTMKQRAKHESIKLRYGSLYTVIENLSARGLITEKEREREGARPERTVYRLTPAGVDELHEWMRDLLRTPAKDYPQFEAALSLIPVLPPEEAVALLRARALELSGTVWKLDAQLGQLAHQDISALPGGQELPPVLAGQKFPPLFTVESEFHLAMVRAELDFVNELVRRISEDGWGPVDLWRAAQAACVRQQESTLASAAAADPASAETTGKRDSKRSAT